MAELKSPVLEGLKLQEGSYHNGNPDHYAIAALRKPGGVLMRLEFTEEERRQIDLGFDLFVEVLTDGGIQPMRFTVSHRDRAEDWQAEGYGQTIPEILEVGNRHVGLEAAARLLRGSYPENWVAMVKKYNETCGRPPLPDDEVASIIHQVRKEK